MRIQKVLGFTVLWLLVWEVLSRNVIRDPSLLPNLQQLAVRWNFVMFESGEMTRDILMSGRRFFISSLIAVPLALFSAFVISKWKILGEPFHFLFSATYALPKVAVYPFLVVAFGIGDASKIALITIGIFYLIYFNVHQGIRMLENHPSYDVLTVFHVPWFEKYRSFYLPGTLPFLIAGLRTGLGYGLVLVVISEMSMSTNGIGLFIWNAWDQFRIIDMYIGVLFLTIWGYLIFWVCDLLEERAFRFGFFRR